MIPAPMHRLIQTTFILLVALTTGCDEREIARQALEHSARQAEQNREMAKLNQHVAEGTKLLVEADAHVRQEFLQAQQTLDQHRQDIEVERKQIAEERVRDPIIANSITGVAILLACVLPLVLGIYVLRMVGPRDTDDALAELLIVEIADTESKLLPRPDSRLAIEGEGQSAIGAVQQV